MMQAPDADPKSVPGGNQPGPQLHRLTQRTKDLGHDRKNAQRLVTDRIQVRQCGQLLRLGIGPRSSKLRSQLGQRLWLSI